MENSLYIKVDSINNNELTNNITIKLKDSFGQ